MLALTRRVGEKITIGEGEDKIVITVVFIQGDRVRLGLEANKNIKIMRNEVLDGQKRNSK